MSAKVEEVVAIKAKIVKAVSELEHGDTAAAVMALCEGLSEMLAYIIEKEQQIPVIHPKGEWVKEPEPPAKIKLPKK